MSATLAENLRAFLLSSQTVRELVGTRVHQDHVPSEEAVREADAAYVWFSRDDAEHEVVAIDEAQGAAADVVTFSLEAIAPTFELRDQLTAAIEGLHNASGTFGDTTIQSLAIARQDDDYFPQAVVVDGWAVSAYVVTVYP